MLNLHEVRRLRELVSETEQIPTKLDRYFIRSCQISRGSEVGIDVLASEAAEIASMVPPTEILGTPVDRSCLAGVEKRSLQVPEVRLIRAKEASVIGYGAIIDGRGMIYASRPVTTEADFDALKISNRRNFDGFVLESRGNSDQVFFAAREAPMRINKRALFLPFIEQANFGSFLTRGLPKLLFVNNALPDVDYYIVPERTPWMLEAFALLGWPRKPVLTVREVCGDVFDELLFPTDFETEGYLGGKAYERLSNFVKRIAGQQDLQAEKRNLFVSRSLNIIARPWYRPLTNEVELEEIARQRGFDVVYPESLDLKGQVNIFSSASTVVGASGSGMLNAIFSAPGTRVVDLESFHTTVRQHAKVYSSSHKDYRFIFGEVAGEPSQPLHLREWSVPCELFEKVLSSILQNSRA
jgi:capsular polysaccharide biosynthesis protein